MSKKQFTLKKEKRSFLMTQEAFLLLQALATKTGIDSSAYLEVKIREFAEQELSPVQKDSIKQVLQEQLRQENLVPAILPQESE